jgi:hypothetical protein
VADQANEDVDEVEEKPSECLEKLKEVISSAKRHIVVQCLVHVPSIAVTMGVVSLTFSNVFWRAPSPEANSTLNALQFAAKAHESLIIFSLSTVIFHRIRLDLIGGRGVPIGLLSSGDQLNALSYIFRWELWGGLLGRHRRGHTALPWVFLCLSLCCWLFFLVHLRPSRGYQSSIGGPLNSFPKILSNLRYMQAPTGSLFPAEVTSEMAPSSCFGDASNAESVCPAAGF